MPEYQDLADLPEDERIKRIGRMVMLYGKVVAVCTDANPRSKADRYIDKLKARFPGIRVLSVFDGPTAGVVTVKLAPPVKPANQN